MNKEVPYLSPVIRYLEFRWCTSNLNKALTTVHYNSKKKLKERAVPRARKQQISLEATPYYHCTSRCVRRAFLCGLDSLTGKNYEHRRQWVEDRILFLGEVFCIDVCAYAVMSNHHHVVLHINMAEAQSLTDLEVCERWHKLYKGTLLTQEFLKGELLDEAQWLAVKEKLDHWRLELANISRWMWALNEPIARMANAEDQCTGRFWTGFCSCKTCISNIHVGQRRFKSQALLDEKALAACMAYVDLNPIRAKMAKTPEESEHTSIKRRIENQETNNPQPLKLAEFVGNPREPKGTHAPGPTLSSTRLPAACGYYRKGYS